MNRLSATLILLWLTVPASAQDTGNSEKGARSFIQITPQDSTPSVRSIAPLDDSNVFFLNKRGQVGVAKFSPGLSLIGWEFYSEVKLNALSSIAAGPGYSVVTAAPDELTQAFDTDEDVELDFFQALVRDWPGRDEGVTITAGPVADAYGRLLFALSPYSEKPETEEEEPAPPKAKLMAWHPAAKQLSVITESQLQINDFAISSKGLLAAQLYMPGYKDGYYISLTALPPFDPAAPDQALDSIPFTLPSLLIPAELTKGSPPSQLAFLHENGTEKLIAAVPESRQLIEIVPSFSKGAWQGAILLRTTTEKPIQTLVEMKPGVLLGGGDDGFLPLDSADDPYRISRVRISDEGIALDFTEPIDRFAAVNPENISVRAVSLQGGEGLLTVQPVIESDARSLILKTTQLKAGTVLRIVCKNVPSESGTSLLSSAVFYTIHQL